MGYNTDFKGELLFTRELTIHEYNMLEKMMGEDIRDHPEWGDNEDDLTFIDLIFNEDETGICWDGGEKTYDLEKKVNFIIQRMHECGFPSFGLSGHMIAQGEDMDDRWLLMIGDDGMAYVEEVEDVQPIVTCPECNHTFNVKDSA